MFVEDKASGETPSYDGFTDFVSRKPRDEKYTWTNSHECACAQYLKSIGQFKETWLNGATDDVMGKLNRIAGGSWDPSKYAGAGGFAERDWTFGACHDRLQKVKELA